MSTMAGAPPENGKEKEEVEERSMIHIKEISNGNGSTTIRIEGGLDSDTIPVLEKSLQRHHKKRRKIYLDIEEAFPITREGREFLMRVREKVMLINIPSFVVLNEEYRDNMV
ncbi:MAG: hypothetical protein V2B19_33695 [Pseudomonadota bacterium]